MTVRYLKPSWIVVLMLSVGMTGGIAAQEGSLAEHLDPQRNSQTFDNDRLEAGRDIAAGGAQAGGVGMKCMACHGLGGAGNAQAPRLAGMPYGYLVTQIQSYLNGDRANAVMEPIAAQLRPDEVHAVIAYYANLPPPDITPPADLDWQMARAGKVLAYAGRQQTDKAPEVTACVMCHNAVGEMDDMPIAPPLAGQPADYIFEQLQAWRSGLRRGSPLGVMSRIANALTPEEMEAVAAFYASQNPAETETD